MTLATTVGVVPNLSWSEFDPNSREYSTGHFMETSNQKKSLKHEYVLGHSESEVERLKTQATLIDPITERFFRGAGLDSGMRVLDVGSGAGDVAFLAKRIVGPSGSVTGVDRAATAVEIARVRAAAQSLQNVTFLEGDAAGMEFEETFDAVVGRYVLQFQPDPALMVRKLASKLRSGGLLVFHEIDWGGLSSLPPVETFDKCCRWGESAVSLHGTETRMGRKLHATFLTAGVGAPEMRLEALPLAGPASLPWLGMFKELMVTLLPHIERFKLASAQEVDVDTLVERISKEAQSTSSVLVSHFQIAAWVRVR